jgi:hypothetical protein
MIDHIFSAICSASSIDTETNSVSLFNIVEQITIFGEDELPNLVQIPLEVFSDWVRSDEEIPSQAKMRVFFCDLNNQCKQQTELDIDLTKVMFYRTRIRTIQIDIKGPGRYKVLVQISQDDGETWNEVARLPLMISFARKSEQEQLSD